MCLFVCLRMNDYTLICKTCLSKHLMSHLQPAWEVGSPSVARLVRSICVVPSDMYTRRHRVCVRACVRGKTNPKCCLFSLRLGCIVRRVTCLLLMLLRYSCIFMADSYSHTERLVACSLNSIWH